MIIADSIKYKLIRDFSPLMLEVIDQSHLHVGHSEAGSGIETHFYVEIVSSAFEGIARAERHRMVYHCLNEEIKKSVHALSLNLISVTENLA